MILPVSLLALLADLLQAFSSVAFAELTPGTTVLADPLPEVTKWTSPTFYPPPPPEPIVWALFGLVFLAVVVLGLAVALVRRRRTRREPPMPYAPIPWRRCPGQRGYWR